MESFYGELQPRDIPNPTSFIQNSFNSSVPDVSIVFDKPKTNPVSYNSWKNDKENVNLASLGQKQVRFQNINRNETQLPSKTPFGISQKDNFIRPELELSIFDNKLSNYPQRFFTHVNNSNQPSQKHNSYQDWLVRLANEEQHEEESASKTENEPSIKDLYRVVQSQNETLVHLQRQVESLLRGNSQLDKAECLENLNKYFGKSKDVVHCNCNNRQMVNSATNTSFSNDPTQISIGVMTSLEFNVNSKSEQNSQKSNLELKKVESEFTRPPVANRFPNKLCSMNVSNTTAEGFSRCRDYSLCEIPEIPEPLEETMSSSNSISVNLQEFNESSDEESEEGENIDENSIGWTVYNNVVGQVQNILEKSPRENERVQQTNGINQATFENLKMVTLNQLHELGISASDLNMPFNIFEANSSAKRRFGSNDLSIEVNQLVMKYLRDDQLSFLVAQNQRIQSPSKPNFIFSSPPGGNNAAANEMSFSTVKYMQKYRLWSQQSQIKSPDQITTCNVQKLISQQEMPQSRYRSQNKILDITALKQQPKLL